MCPKRKKICLCKSPRRLKLRNFCVNIFFPMEFFFFVHTTWTRLSVFFYFCFGFRLVWFGFGCCFNVVFLMIVCVYLLNQYSYMWFLLNLSSSMTRWYIILAWSKSGNGISIVMAFYLALLRLSYANAISSPNAIPMLIYIILYIPTFSNFQ